MVFTLEPERWYALELLLGAHSQGGPQFKPIFVEKITPRKTGKGLLGLQFYSPEGESRAEARILKRMSEYLVAELGDNCGIFRPLTFEWLARYCPDLVEKHPFPSFPWETRYEGDMQFYLDQVFHEQIRHPAFAGYTSHTLALVSDGPVSSSGGVRVKAQDCPLVIEARHVLALQQKVVESVRLYFPHREDLAQNILFQLEYEEHDVLSACALRFDGYKYVKQKLGDDASLIHNYLDRSELPEDPLVQMAVFFHLQRYLMKWGGEHEPLHGQKWRFFRTLFLAVVNQPVPLEFQHAEIYSSWLHNYEPCREQVIETVRCVHDSTEYDDSALPTS